MLIFLMVSRAGAGRPPKQEKHVRFEKRGPQAWENFAAAPLVPLVSGGTTLLIVHAVADASSLQWIPKVKGFLTCTKRANTDLSIPEGLDRALAQHMDWLCYGEQRSSSMGSLLLFGIICLLPEVNGRLPLAARSLQSWTRLAIMVEGGPLPEEIVYLMAFEMIQDGYIYHCFWVLTQYDTYGREQDMEQLCGADISYHKRTMALVFGVSSRGESVKTGHNQGVLVRPAVVADILLALKKDAGVSKIFPITQEELRRVWHRVLRRLGLPFAGPPHSLRHSGPSEDLAQKRSTLENVRRRGRWKTLDSVQRYTKTFALTRFRARIPEETHQKAQKVSRDLRAALVAALGSPAARDSEIAKRCIKSLRLRQARENTPDMENVRKPLVSDHSDGGLTDDDGWASD